MGKVGLNLLHASPMIGRGMLRILTYSNYLLYSFHLKFHLYAEIIYSLLDTWPRAPKTPWILIISHSRTYYYYSLFFLACNGPCYGGKGALNVCWLGYILRLPFESIYIVVLLGRSDAPPSNTLPFPANDTHWDSLMTLNSYATGCVLKPTQKTNVFLHQNELDRI